MGAFIYLHIARALYINSYKLNASIWTSGILIIFTTISTVFIGYILTWGQISFWGITVIKNIISSIPSLVQSLTGNFTICNQTLIRLSTIHFILPLSVTGILIIHISYCHYQGSSNPLCI